MNKQEYTKALDALFTLSCSVTSDIREQATLLATIKAIHTEPSVSDRERIRAIIGMFYDGLAYGNWPWIVNGVNTLTNPLVNGIDKQG